MNLEFEVEEFNRNNIELIVDGRSFVLPKSQISSVMKKIERYK